MSRVFVVQCQMRWDGEKLVPKFDLGPAQEFGELVFLLSPSAAPFNSPPIVEELSGKLAGYTDDDYLLLVGNPCLIGMVVALAADANDGRVKMLQWSGRDQRYRVVEAEMWQGGE
jgi:hypothetical protein